MKIKIVSHIYHIQLDLGTGIYIQKEYHLINSFPEESVIHPYNYYLKVSTTHSINTYMFVKSSYKNFGLFGLRLFTFEWYALPKVALTRVYKNLNLMNITIVAVFVYSLLIAFYF